jgi:hypothetical protein
MALLAASTTAVFWQVSGHGFINFDDPAYVTYNPIVREGLTWAGVKWAFTQLHGEATYWHPVTWLSHMLDCQLFGLNPAGHHLTSLFLHTVNTVLLFAVLRRMTGRRGPSAMVAALFALHPLQVDSVAWVAERKNVLSAFFFLLTLWAYARYAGPPKSEPTKRPPKDDRSPVTFHVSRITHHASRITFLLPLPLLLRPRPDEQAIARPAAIYSPAARLLAAAALRSPNSRVQSPTSAKCCHGSIARGHASRFTFHAPRSSLSSSRSCHSSPSQPPRA